MDAYRFYAPDLKSLADRDLPIPLSEDQARHAATVLRLTAGTAIELFDGFGHSASAKITGDPEKRLKTHVNAQLTSPPKLDPPPAPHLTLATAIPKGDRAEWLVEQASQLNVSNLLWLDTDRGVVKLKETSGKLDKFRRLAVESAKQCGRNHLLHIDLAPPLAQLLSDSQDRLFWLEPRAGGQSILQALQTHRPEKIIALIGPEGGWSAREFEMLEAAANAATPRLHRVRLTSTVLRIETAAAAVAALVMGG